MHHVGFFVRLSSLGCLIPGKTNGIVKFNGQSLGTPPGRSQDVPGRPGTLWDVPGPLSGRSRDAPKTFPKCSREAPGTLQDAPGRRPGNLFSTLWQKKSLQGSILGPPKIPKWLQKRPFEARSALWASKNGLREGFWKKLEKLKK